MFSMDNTNRRRGASTKLNFAPAVSPLNDNINTGILDSKLLRQRATNETFFPLCALLPHDSHVYGREDMYNVGCLLNDILPQLLHFCRYIYANYNDCFIGFLSRDTYFVYKLFSKMYPELSEGKDYAYVYSSRKCFTSGNTDNYYAYLKSFCELKDKLLLVDIFGSAQTFSTFYTKYIDVPNSIMSQISILFFIKHDMTFRPNTFSFYVQSDFGKMFDIEAILRAHHAKVIGFTDEIKPIFDPKDDDLVDKRRDRIVSFLDKKYNSLTEYTLFRPNIQYMTTSYVKMKNFFIDGNDHTVDDSRDFYHGLLALDIDNTISNVSIYKYVKTMVQECYGRKIKIALITARQCPFLMGDKYLPTMSELSTVLDNIGFTENDYCLDIWYNPWLFSHIKTPSVIKSNNDAMHKVDQLLLALEIYNIPLHRAVFFDDRSENISVAMSHGIRCAKVNNNIGIDNRCLQLFYEVMN